MAEAAGLTSGDIAALQTLNGLTDEQADHMVENVVGTFGLPLGIGLNFVVNGREVLVPMVIEEPSVVAGASFMAKLARAQRRFHCQRVCPGNDRADASAGCQGFDGCQHEAV